jgi:hypothetical protein
MSAAVDQLSRMLAAGGELADGLASAVAQLVVKGSKLGELEDHAAVGIDGNWRPIKRPPPIWFERLVLAAKRGAFARLPVDRIVDRILLPPPGGDEI